MKNTRFYFLILTFLIFSEPAFSQDPLYNLINKDQITMKHYKEFIGKNLIQNIDTIVGLYIMDTKESNKLGRLQIEKLIILTDNKLIEYMSIAGRESKETAFYKDILDIKINEIDSNIQVLIFDRIFHFEKLNENHLLTNQVKLIINIYSPDGKNFYDLLINCWKTSNSYSESRNIYFQFYDTYGKKIPRPSELTRRKFILALTKEMDRNHTVFEIDEYSNCYLVEDNYLTQISYNVIKETYKLLRIKIEPIPEDMFRMFAITLYEKEVKEKHSLPYKYREYLYLSAFELETNDMIYLIEHIKKD